MLLNFKRSTHQEYLLQLPKIPQVPANIQTLYSPANFRQVLLQTITDAKQRIYLVTLYLEQDQGGRGVLEAIYQAKQKNPMLEIAILVDWHRAQRGRIGDNKINTNADWYYRMAQLHPGIDVPVYGVPVNTHEALGVLHLKGFIIDDQVIYSGASLNNVYLHQHDKYRYDRYQIIRNLSLANTLLRYIQKQLLIAPAVNRLDSSNRPKNLKIKNDTRLFRQSLRTASYCYKKKGGGDELAIIPLVGLGRKNPLNKTIHHLICSARTRLILCTPYFNMPRLLVRNLIALLHQGRHVEIIVGDKTSNDFYIPTDQPFKIIGTLPYLYEINLRQFLSQLQRYIDNKQLIVRLWKDGDNSYHLKGIWVDDEWLLLTGNNLNPRAWKLDLENALLIQDPHNQLCNQRELELTVIKNHTKMLTHFTELQSISDYPIKVRKLICRLRRIRIDRLLRRIL